MYNSTLGPGTNRSLLCFPFSSRERNVRATESREITDSLGSSHAVDSGFQVPEFIFLVSGTWIQAFQSFAEFRIPQANFFLDSGIRITWHRANHTDSWLKLHMRSHLPSPHIRCSTHVPTNFPFRQVHKKLDFTRNVANKWGREWSTKNFGRRRDKSWLCSYQKKRP